MIDAKIVVKTRDQKGSANARRLRRTGLIPGVIYSNGEEARAISLPKHDFQQMLNRHAGEHLMIQIQIDDGKEESVLLKDVQRNAMTGGVNHVDLQNVELDKVLQIEVPLELTGEAEGVKQGGVLDHQLHQIAIECLPMDIPEQIEIDVSNLKIGDRLLVKDLTVDSSKLQVLIEEEAVVVLVALPKVVEETEGDEKVPAEPEVLREKKEDEAE